MALQMLDYQGYFWDTDAQCGKCDSIYYPTGAYYPVADGIPAFQVKLLPIGDNLFSNPDFTGGTTDWALDGFAYNDDNVCLDNVYPPTFIPSIRQTISGLGLTNIHQLTFNYTNLGFVNNPFTIKMEVYNQWNALVDTQLIQPVVTATGKTVTLYFTPPGDGSASHTFWFYLVFDNTYSITQTTGFCFDSFSIKELDTIASVWQDFSFGSDTELTTAITYYGDIALIELSGLDTSTNDCFRLRITSGFFDTHYSNYIKLDTFGQCKTNKQALITWTDDCYFKDLDYSHLPFTNAWYLKGFVQDLPNANKERIQRINMDGTVDTVYNYSIGKAELRIGAYTKYVHRIMARALEHKTVTIDGEYYMLDEGSSYTTASLDNGLYTGRCELVRVGSEVVKSICCC